MPDAAPHPLTHSSWEFLMSSGLSSSIFPLHAVTIWWPPIDNISRCLQPNRLWIHHIFHFISSDFVLVFLCISHWYHLLSHRSLTKKPTTLWRSCRRQVQSGFDDLVSQRKSVSHDDDLADIVHPTNQSILTDLNPWPLLILTFFGGSVKSTILPTFCTKFRMISQPVSTDQGEVRGVWLRLQLDSSRRKKIMPSFGIWSSRIWYSQRPKKAQDLRWVATLIEQKIGKMPYLLVTCCEIF